MKHVHQETMHHELFIKPQQSRKKVLLNIIPDKKNLGGSFL